MTVIEIIYPAKCKDCKYFTQKVVGKKLVSRCARLGTEDLQNTTPVGWSVTLKTKACKEFKLFGT